MSAKEAAAKSGPKFHRPAHEVPDFADFFGDDTSGLSCLSNDNIAEGEGRYRYQHALEPSDIKTEAVEGGSFDAVWFYVFRVPSRDSEGALTGAHYRIVFMDALGRTFESHSDTAERTLRGWIADRGWDKWSPSVCFTLEKIKGGSGRVYHQLRTVIEGNGQGQAKGASDAMP